MLQQLLRQRQPRPHLGPKVLPVPQYVRGKPEPGPPAPRIVSFAAIIQFRYTLTAAGLTSGQPEVARSRHGRDAPASTDTLIRVLDAADAMPRATHLRARTYELVRLAPGATVVDVGRAVIN